MFTTLHPLSPHAECVNVLTQALFAEPASWTLSRVGGAVGAVNIELAVNIGFRIRISSNLKMGVEISLKLQ